MIRVRKYHRGYGVLSYSCIAQIESETKKPSYTCVLGRNLMPKLCDWEEN